MCRSTGGSASEARSPYDDLVIATGSYHSYFGHDEWERFAPGLKTIGDATRVRRRILLAFERAEPEPDPAKRAALLTFVLVGGGPTGVEMAGSIAELAHRALLSDFRRINPKVPPRSCLIEAGPRILAAFPEGLAQRAAKYLRKRGVEIRIGGRVEQVDAEGVFVSGQRIAAYTVIWAAGVVASPAGRWLGAETDRAGRVKVGGDLTVPGAPEIFVIGDTSLREQDGKPLPGLAPVAMQQGRYVARAIRERASGAKSSSAPFHYHDKGNLATVGRSFAIADLGRIRLSGFPAWIAWLGIHIYFLIGFRNRLVVLLEWAWAYLTFQRGARLITGEDCSAGRRSSTLGPARLPRRCEAGAGGSARRPGGRGDRGDGSGNSSPAAESLQRLDLYGLMAGRAIGDSDAGPAPHGVAGVRMWSSLRA